MHPEVSILPTALLASALTLILQPNLATAANYAAEVIAYQPGTGGANGYDQPNAALGEPSRLTPGEFGGPVDPFSAPWQPSQILSLGASGSLTVRFTDPVLNHRDHPAGLDFLIFGSAAFLITNGDYSGGGITDGSLFGASTGPTRISVSADGTRFFELDPRFAPTVDGFFPTDGSGDFSRPVPAGLTEADFNGLGLDGIRNLYAGSGGGAGYDIDWARQPDGTPAGLSSIQYVRLDVLGDRAEIDGFSAVPEAGTQALLLLGATVLCTSRRSRLP